MLAIMVKIVLVISGVSIVRTALGQVMNFSKLLLLHPHNQDKLRLCLELGSRGLVWTRWNISRAKWLIVWVWSCIMRIIVVQVGRA